ncbi:putative acetyltransferase [Oryzomicrobium terrae]|uniref:Putative acetyltransferase n=1 Tax=Oryzomicrobium terrae TaxID=1735038 RepID=A0A5C1E4X0_9RHOO|nr:GNAT family N-acetyltransferase [Oryzomicrobium terrae]QEL63569.1 putative acetyltransferase [Oryzomicrobium terrae]
MRIRPLLPGEALTLLGVFRASVHGLAARDYTPAQLDAWAPRTVDADYEDQWIARIQANRPYVAEVEGVPAGFADLQPTGYIDQFFVAADYAGQGVGSMLMRHLLDTARAQGLTRLHSHVSLTAQPFFRRFGFVVEQVQYPVVRGVALENAVMSLQLN